LKKDFYWLSVLVYHGKEGMMDQNSSAHGIQKAERFPPSFSFIPSRPPAYLMVLQAFRIGLPYLVNAC
jgi:hypothetical protein